MNTYSYYTSQDDHQKRIDNACADGRELKYLPKAFHTFEIVKQAVATYPHCIEHVSYEKLMENLCFENEDCDSDYIIYMFYDQLDILFELAIDKDSTSILSIPKTYVTNKLINYALKLNPKLISLIPKPSDDQKINAICQCPRSLASICNPTEEDCRLGLGLDQNVFKLIKNPTEDTCVLALDHSSNSTYVNLSSKKVIQKAISNKKISIDD